MPRNGPWPAMSPATDVPWSRAVIATSGMASNMPATASFQRRMRLVDRGVDDRDPDILAAGAVGLQRDALEGVVDDARGLLQIVDMVGLPRSAARASPASWASTTPTGRPSGMPKRTTVTPSSVETRCERISSPKDAAMSATTAGSPSTVASTSSGTNAPVTAGGATVGGAATSEPAGGGGCEPAAGSAGGGLSGGVCATVSAGSAAEPVRQAVAGGRIGKQVDDQVRQHNGVGVGSWPVPRSGGLPHGRASSGACPGTHSGPPAACRFRQSRSACGEVRIVGLRERGKGGDENRRPEYRSNALTALTAIVRASSPEPQSRQKAGQQ